MSKPKPGVAPEVSAARSRAGLAANAIRTPEQRAEYASRAGRASAAVRNTADYWIKKLAESPATLTPEQVDRLATILRPAVASSSAPVSVERRAA